MRGSTSGGQLDLRLLDRIERGGLVEVFDLFLPARTDHLGSPHGTGVVERVFVHAGTITVGPASEPITLGPGDYARYSGDGPHVYRSADEDVHGMLLVGYPPARVGRCPRRRHRRRARLVPGAAMQFGQRHGTERTSGNPTIETLWSLALGLTGQH